MVINTGKATKCRHKFKAPSLQTKNTKIEVPFENMGVNGKQFEDSHEKNSLLVSTKKPRETHCPYMQELTTNLVTRSTKIEEKLKKEHSDQNSWNFAGLQQRSQVLTFSTLR